MSGLNRSLVYFSLFLVLLGAGSNFYPLSLLGLFILIPSLLSPGRPPVTKAPPAPTQRPWRIAPPTRAQPGSAATQAKPAPPMAPVTQQPQTYPQALFPATMFPSLSQTATPAPATATTESKPEGRDELIEVGAILALLKVALG